jgi:hypothetical protein
MAASVGTNGAAKRKAAAPAQRGNEIQAAIRSGKPVVVVVAKAPQKGDDSDETYGDWAAYLNRFARRAGSAVSIVKVTPERYAALVAEPKLTSGYATLFLRGTSHALLYRGMILEPQVYEQGRKYSSLGPDDKWVASDGLQEVTLALRR